MFIGRESELAKLERSYKKDAFQMAVVYGRRRVGKTTLISEFCRDKNTLFFTALEQSDTDNLADFSKTIAQFFGLPESTRFASWKDAFDFIADQASRPDSSRFVFVFDEFPYAVKRCSALPSILQVAIDHKFVHTNCYIFLCGSSQGAMESDVLGRKSPLYGRRTIQIQLRPLDYIDAARMLPWANPDEAFRTYACVGGVPYYLAQIDESLSFRENIAELFFDPAGFLYGEPQMLLRQELQEPATYNSILRAIAAGATRPKQIAERAGVVETTLPGYLSTLSSLKLIERRVPFGQDPERSKKGIYRICEPAFDFWFRFVMPNSNAIESGLGGAVAESITEEQLSSYFGRWFEHVCAQWVVRQALVGALELPVTEVSSWWGTDPRVHEQVDIDFIAADKSSRQMMVGECKYRRSFNETEALEKLRTRASLIKGYKASEYLLFSKDPLAESTAKKVSQDETLRSVTLDEMYAQV